MQNTVRSIAAFGDRYFKKFLADYDREQLKNDWWEGLKFFFNRCFYQGRNDAISYRVEQTSVSVLEKFFNQRLPDFPRLEEQNYCEIRDELQKVIGKGKIGRGRDVEMVISILRFLSKSAEHHNIVAYAIGKIENKQLQQIYKELDDIYSIGPKIASFYLRDIVCLYRLDEKLSSQDFFLLQPIDTWVRKVAMKINIACPVNTDDQIRKSIVKACEQAAVSPIDFNQGAWFLGTHTFDILLENVGKLIEN